MAYPAALKLLLLPHLCLGCRVPLKQTTQLILTIVLSRWVSIYFITSFCYYFYIMPLLKYLLLAGAAQPSRTFPFPPVNASLSLILWTAFCSLWGSMQNCRNCEHKNVAILYTSPVFSLISKKYVTLSLSFVIMLGSTWGCLLSLAKHKCKICHCKKCSVCPAPTCRSPPGRARRNQLFP